MTAPIFKKRKPRTYEPIWLRLKQYETVVLEAAPAFHKRIKKAVIKEKNLDQNFLTLQAAAGCSHYKLRFVSEGSQLKIWIDRSILPKDIL